MKPFIAKQLSGNNKHQPESSVSAIWPIVENVKKNKWTLLVKRNFSHSWTKAHPSIQAFRSTFSWT